MLWPCQQRLRKLVEHDLNEQYDYIAIAGHDAHGLYEELFEILVVVEQLAEEPRRHLPEDCLSHNNTAIAILQVGNDLNDVVLGQRAINFVLVLLVVGDVTRIAAATYTISFFIESISIFFSSSMTPPNYITHVISCCAVTNYPLLVISRDELAHQSQQAART